MPKFLENDLRRAGRKKGFTGEKLEHYVYGGMNNLGAMHGSEETAKGREMEEKHEADMKTAPASDEPMKEMRIEFHRGHGGKVTGATVHHHMMSKPSKSAAFLEDTHHSFPFGADQHEAMMDHVHEHSAGQMGAGAAAPKEQPAGANQMEEEAGEGE